MLLPARVVSAGQRRPRISLGPRSFSPSLGLAISGKGLTSDQHLAAKVQRQGNPHPRDSVFVLPSAAPQAGLTGLVHLPPSVDPAIPQKKAEALKFYCTKSILADWTVGPRGQMGRGNWTEDSEMENRMEKRNATSVFFLVGARLKRRGGSIAVEPQRAPWSGSEVIFFLWSEVVKQAFSSIAFSSAA